jgi:hypothetical protein
MHVVSRSRRAWSVEMRSSISACLRETLPVALRGSSVVRERGEPGSDLGERDSGSASGTDEGDAAQDGALVATLVALRPP